LAIGTIQAFECREQEVPLRLRVRGSLGVRWEERRQATFAHSHERKIHVGGNRIEIVRCDGAYLEFAASR
jgi:hypothetical protein